MKLPAFILILTWTLTDILAAPPSYINTYVGEDGRTYYKNPLYCSYTSLYETQPYNSKTTNYVTRSDQKCCTYSWSRNSCCLDTKTNQCKCDPTVDCGSVTTSAPSTTTESLTTSAKTTAATTAAAARITATTTVAVTTAASTTVADTTAATTTVAVTTAASTKFADTTAASTTVAVTTATATKVADTTAASTTVADTTAATTTVAVTTAASTKFADTTAASTTVAVTTATATKVADTTAASTTVAVTTAASTTVAVTTAASTKVADTTAASSTVADKTTVSSTVGTTTADSTTTAAPTTTGFKSLCPQRVTEDCTYSGLTRIGRKNTKLIVCNAVLTEATVNGTVKPTFLTTRKCKDIIEDGSSYFIHIGNQTYPITSPVFTLYYGPSGTAFIDVNNDHMNILDTMGSCEQSACAYDKSSMDGLVDFTNCTNLSWGTYTCAGYIQNGLGKSSVVLNQSGCADIPDLPGANNTLCFKTTSTTDLTYSVDDSGAPVYCSAYSGKEWVLIGVSTYPKDCDTIPEYKVLPFPG